MYESKIYRVLQGGYGVPGVKWFGSEGDYNVLVIDLLGIILVLYDSISLLTSLFINIRSIT
jgi:hypothetical protein